MKRNSFGLVSVLCAGLVAGCAVEKRKEEIRYPALQVHFYGDGKVDFIVRRTNAVTSIYNPDTGESTNIRGEAIVRLRKGRWDIYHGGAYWGKIVAGRVVTKKGRRN
jgi:hypothetical protein